MDDIKITQLMQYLLRGWALVPLHDVTAGHCSCSAGPSCKSAGKHPRTSEWQRPENLVITEAQLLAALSRRPSCNWGLATGLISGVWALDLDPKNVIDWPAVHALLATLPPTWTQRTGSGGQHWLFTLPEDFVPNNSSKRLPDGLDVRGARAGEVSGGQIVLAPSVSGVGAYEVLHGGAVLGGSAALLEAVRPAPPRERVAPVAGFNASADTMGRYVVAGISAALSDLRAAASGRNGRAFAVACRVQELANTGLVDRDAVYDAWWGAAAAHPDPLVTVPDRELLSVWSSAERTVGDRPADLSHVGGPSGWANVGGDRIPFSGAPGAAPGLGQFGSGSGGARAGGGVVAEPAGLDATGYRHLKVVRASEIRMRATRWLWEEEDGAQWMPLGGLTLLGGREGIGKSTWGYRLAAMLSVGKLPGSFFGEPRAVVVAAGEDAWAQTVVPRLVAAGADLGLVFRVDVVQPDGGIDGLSLPEDTAGLTELCHRERVALVLLDPLMSAVSGKLDTHKDAEVRKALSPLSRLADEAQVGVLGLIHVNKSQGNDLLTRLMGSRAFSAVARSVLVCHKEDNTEELGTGPASFLFGQAKSNLGRKVQHSYRYSIEGTRVGYDAELQQPVFSSRIRIEEIVTGGIDDQVAASEAPRRAAPKAAEALEWLTSYLQGAGAVSAAAGIPSAVVKAEGVEAGHTDKAIRSAREKNGALVQTSHNPNGPGTVWFLCPTSL
jgi:hypothetical protein